MEVCEAEVSFALKDDGFRIEMLDFGIKNIEFCIINDEFRRPGRSWLQLHRPAAVSQSQKRHSRCGRTTAMLPLRGIAMRSSISLLLNFRLNAEIIENCP